MRPASSLVSLALGLGSLATVAASSWENHGVIARAPASATSSTADNILTVPTSSGSPKSDASQASSASPGPTRTDANTAEPTSDKPTGSDRSTGSDKPSPTKEDGEKATHTEFPPDAAPAGVNILTPIPNVQPTVLYRIGETVTWGWNYTSLLATPTAIDVLISCSVAAETWTLTSNMSFTTSASYIWDTNEQANAVEKPLLTQMYTLIVKDSDADINAPPQPGYLGTVRNFFNFGLYAGKPYTPFSDWKCSVCSGANTLSDRHTGRLALIMSFLTVISYTWLVAGLELR
ncbi:hypothetical protein L249_7940 [Ophiocordyceps polyrhachis-furcata BCC 54312]|uniref:DUF7137 domain-containing protein n=1 Tax=Ophiocordyceps polyrhachis-furcata BCC 54312 TaxID=1330021 RepID=A0A367LH74_9HYPO|nr:hypothetical protein L249_7940 [Ophiocordyceps polyrhachis-furcata BCC 54312]